MPPQVYLAKIEQIFFSSQNQNNNVDDEAPEEEQGAAGPVGAAGPAPGFVSFNDFQPNSDSIFSTAVDESTIDAAKERHVQDAMTDTRTDLSQVMTDKLRYL